MMMMIDNGEVVFGHSEDTLHLLGGRDSFGMGTYSDNAPPYLIPYEYQKAKQSHNSTTERRNQYNSGSV